MCQFFIDNTLHDIQISTTWEQICVICKQYGCSKFTNIAQGHLYQLKREVDQGWSLVELHMKWL